MLIGMPNQQETCLHDTSQHIVLKKEQNVNVSKTKKDPQRLYVGIVMIYFLSFFHEKKRKTMVIVLKKILIKIMIDCLDL